VIGDLFSQTAEDLGLAPALADDAARERIRTDLDTTLVVEAAAGTGKTSELVRRMVALLAAGRAQLDRLVAVTFTDFAAGELKLRLRTEIEKTRLDPLTSGEARRRLNDALPQLEEARIGTIHSFCSDLLRERPVEAGVDPLFEVAAGDVAWRTFGRCFDRWFERQLESPGPGVRRVLRRWRREQTWSPGRRRDEGPKGLLRSAAWELVERRDFPAPWARREGFERDREIQAIVAEVAELGAWADRGNPEDYFTKSLIALWGLAADIERAERSADRDFDWLEARLIASARDRHWTWKGYGGKGSAEFPKPELLRRRNELFARLEAFVAEAGADLAPSLRDELWPLVEDYESAKTRAGCLDFLDLLIRARTLVRDNADVRRQLQERFTHLFVDEFQDTDPLQAEILLLIAADDPSETDWRRARPLPGKLFVVADPKQSIYRFRRADVALYEGIKRHLLATGAERVELNVSFRSSPEIQEAINAAFAPRMTGGTPSQARYVPLAPFRADAGAQPAVVALPVPEPYSDWGLADWRIEESQPDVTAAFVEWLVRSSGWTVTERESPEKRVPIEPRHICLLFRRMKSFGQDMARGYVTALEARHLPHVLVGGSSFHEREEVEAMRNALAAIEWPDDELAMFATLRGPLFALTDAALLAFRDRVGGLHPFRRVPDGEPEPVREVAEALAILRELHRGRNRRPVAETIARLLAATRAHAAFAIWPTGMQALANLSRLMDLARRAERQGIVSFRAFVEHLEDEAERGEAGDAPIVEEGIEGVRIMTVHRAKGLEFPVVILADLTAKDTTEQPSRWVDVEKGLCAMRLANAMPPELLDHAGDEMEREREEAMRLLYVAATRARDLLVVPVIGDQPYRPTRSEDARSGWLAALDDVVYPARGAERQPEDDAPVAGADFGDDTVTQPRPPKAPIKGSVVPGLHRPAAGGHRVVWWGPKALRLGVRESVGLSQTKILQAAEDESRSAAGLRDSREWAERRDAVRATATAPSVSVVTATELAGAEPEPGAAAPSWAVGVGEVAVEMVAGAGERPSGVRFGDLVHRVLSVVDFGDDATAVAGHAAIQARLVGAGEDEASAAAAASSRTLAHPLMRRAARAAEAGACRREMPLVVCLADGTLVESVADLAFREPDAPGWTVVDFKTDAELAGRIDVYRRQVALYAQGIAEATGLPARAVLLRIA
jgi:ATP-dependent exoDNAse (exonuclease V) beta subunit